MARSDDFAAIKAAAGHLIFDLTPTPLGGATLTGPWVPIPRGNIPGGAHVKTDANVTTATVEVDYSNDTASDADAVKTAWSSAASGPNGAAELQGPTLGAGFTPLTGFCYMRLRRTDANPGLVIGTAAWGC